MSDVTPLALAAFVACLASGTAIASEAPAGAAPVLWR